MILFRKANKDDIKDIKELLQLTSKDPKAIEECIDSCMVAEYDEKIVGIICLEICDPAAFISFLSVHPDYQDQEIADGLVRAMINFADRRSLKKLFVIANENVRFFEEIGFVPSKWTSVNTKCQQCHVEGFGETLMELDIDEFFNSPHCKKL